MPTLKGVIVYEIFPNSCLNGVYSNTHGKTKNEIFNEIARKKESPNDGKIEGLYTCCYIDLDSIPFICDLKISPASEGKYKFEWMDTEKNKLKFKGIGWLTKENQITVSYSDI
jgi:hypothetical protein